MGQTILIFFLLSFVAIGSCTKCYQCNSQADPLCGESFKSTIAPVDCSTDAYKNYNSLYLYNVLPSEVFGGVAGAPRFCHKIVLESGTIFRTCLDGTASDKNKICETMKELTKSETPGKKVKKCEVCDKDNCNGAGALSFSLPLSALTLFISYLIYKQ